MFNSDFSSNNKETDLVIDSESLKSFLFDRVCTNCLIDSKYNSYSLANKRRVLKKSRVRETKSSRGTKAAETSSGDN